MARSVSDGALRPARHARLLASPLLGALQPRPVLALALATLIALIIAYAVRPTVKIDMGGDLDAAFLREFNGREIAAAGAAEVFAWQPGQRRLALPGNRAGLWIAVLEAAPGQPDDVLREAALAINDVRVDMPRRTARTMVATIPPALGAAETLVFELVSPLVGGADPPRDVVGSVTLAPARTYRWSRDDSSIVLPNLGRGAWQVDLSVITAHPDGAPVEAQVLANGRPLARLPESEATRRVSLLVPNSLVDSGTLDLALRANTFTDPRPLGIFISEASVAPIRGSVPYAIVPPWPVLLYSLTIVLAVYVTLVTLLQSVERRASGVEIEGHGDAVATTRSLIARLQSADVLAILGTSVVILALLWALTIHRFPTSFMLPRLALFALWSLALLLALRPLTRWLLTFVEPRAEPAPRLFADALLLIFFTGYWLKAVGMLYPYFVAIDVQWHMDRVRWILDGQLPLLYGTSSPLNESTMPTAEWGASRPVIPYSPWYHMVAALFALLPFKLETTANMVSLLLDSSRVILIALLARKASLGRRTTLLAAALYGALPVAFLLHSWGNVPTTAGLWLTLATTTFLVAAWERLGRPAQLAALTLLLLATFLIYTVTGVFMGVFLVLFTLIFWLITTFGPARCAPGSSQSIMQSGLRPLWLATAIAMGLALLIYYGQYIGPIWQVTVPYMSTVFAQGPQSVGVERPPFGAYLWAYVPHLDYRIWPGDYLYYGIAIPLLFVAPGLLALRRSALVWSVFAAWFTVAVLFMLAGYRISMVDKQLFAILPIICICWAIYADRYWRRGRWGRLLIVAIYLFTLAAALDQWILRIVTSPVSG